MPVLGTTHDSDANDTQEVNPALATDPLGQSAQLPFCSTCGGVQVHTVFPAVAVAPLGHATQLDPCDI